MKMKQLLLNIGIVILFTHCSYSNRKTYYIKTNHARGVKESSEVICRGVTIGKIGDIILIRDYVIIPIEINKDFKISKRAEIVVSNKDLITRVIEILNPKETTNNFYKSGDTILVDLNFRNIDVTIRNRVVPPDSIEYVIKEDFTKFLKQDRLSKDQRSSLR